MTTENEREKGNTPEGVFFASTQNAGTEGEPQRVQSGAVENNGEDLREPFEEEVRRPILTGRVKGKSLVRKADAPPQPSTTPEQRLLILDTWRRSGLPVGEFASLVGVSKHALRTWKKRFDEHGPAGLMDRPKGGSAGSKLPDLTKRTILMLKASNPDWGCQRISDMLARGPALPASPNTVARVLHEAGYELEDASTRPHPDQPRTFERARPNQLWQTDLFTFLLKRQNRRVYLVAYIDDHSRFITGFGLHAGASTALVLEVLRAAIASFGPPEEVLTDNGPQYVTWRGKSQFSKDLEKQGIRQIVAKPRRPQTLGKIERFWGTMWRECIEAAVFFDLAEARTRIGHFIDHYNFQRCHQGIDGLVPADRFFGVGSEVLATLKARVAANALDLARHGAPKRPFYMTGQMGGKSFSVHAEGERMILKRQGEERQEVELVGPELAGLEPSEAGELPQPICPDGSPAVDADTPLGPGESVVDGMLQQLDDGEVAPGHSDGGAV